VNARHWCDRKRLYFARFNLRPRESLMTGAGDQILKANAGVSEAKCSAFFTSCGLTHMFLSPGLQCRSLSARRLIQIRLSRRLASHALGRDPAIAQTKLLN